MPFNGSGVYSAPASTFNPAVPATDIDASDWNNLLSDISTALSTTITNDGQTTTGTRIPFAAGISSDTILPKTAGAGVEVQGVTDGSSAPSGYVGEIIESYVANGAGPTVLNATYTDITSISLTAGDWDVDGMLGLGFGSFGATRVTSASSSSSATLPSDDGGGIIDLSVTFAPNVTARFPTGTRRFSVSTTTTIYLVGYNETGGSSSGFGYIRARRVR